MYSRYKASIISPKNIPLYTNKKFVTFIYFIILGLIYILPGLINVIDTGGIDSYYYDAILDEMRYSTINYSIIDNTLKQNLAFDEISARTENSIVTDDIQITFTNIKDVDLENDLTETYLEISKISITPIKLVFTEKRIIGLLSFQGIVMDLELGTYEEFCVQNLTLGKTNDEKTIVGFSKLLHSIHDKYKSEILMVTIPSLLISGILALALTILIPTFVVWIFNKGMGVKFGKVYHMAIYAFTIYVFGSAIFYWNIGSFIILIFEIISFIYLQIAMRSYFIEKMGGLKK